eukprot:TRINITY_DN16301_c0_g1_i1.p1 TRINITY_DN16301_c0_g1~~TRINITY_DN16301_c0_g1_i1.p1  ORF type:complete len:232 (+),score=45.03 TRINITY_DN16301_c0_g1_i1:72-767(+)
MSDAPADLGNQSFRRVRRSFEQFDVNGDGVITAEELSTVMKTLDASTWTDEKLEALFLAIDADTSNKISFREFTTWAFTDSVPEEEIAKEVLDFKDLVSPAPFDEAPVSLHCSGSENGGDFATAANIVLYADGRALCAFGDEDHYTHRPFFYYDQYSGAWAEGASKDDKKCFDITLFMKASEDRSLDAVSIFSDPSKQVRACKPESFKLVEEGDGKFSIRGKSGPNRLTQV